VLVFVLFVSCHFAQQKRLGRFWRSTRQTTRFLRKEVPFGVPTLPKTSKGFISQKIKPGIGISSLYKTMNNFSIVHAIFIQISSIGAAWRKKYKNSIKSPKFRSSGHFL
jgi:hypothetical protein